MDSYTMTIDGRAVGGKKMAGVINPATGKVFAEVPECSREQLDEAMAAAARAQREWSKDVTARKQALLAMSKAIKANVAKIAPVLTQEQGKPLAKATEEAVGAAVWTSTTAKLD
ncbi:MAG: aldehyde dehydrogenase family protein, partial [Candidatus Binatia bacterium]